MFVGLLRSGKKSELFSEGKAERERERERERASLTNALRVEKDNPI